MNRHWITAAVAVALAASGFAARADDGVGPEVCAECHEEVAADFAANPHSGLDSAGLAAAGEWSCTSCHGDPTAHLEEGGEIFNFGDDVTAPERWGRCLSCHGADVQLSDLDLRTRESALRVSLMPPWFL